MEFLTVDQFVELHCSECKYVILCAGVRLDECAADAGVVLEEE